MMRVYQIVALSVFLMGLELALGKRVGLNASSEYESGCDAQTCTSFEEAQDGDGVCSCLPFVAETGSKSLHMGMFFGRAERVLYTMAQSMRYLSDYETTKSGLQSLWLPTKFKNAKLLSSSFKDLEFLQSALEAIPEIRELASVPVKDVEKGKVPAGVWPIMVEVWDKDPAAGEFIGEVGVPLVVGRREYNQVPLQPNPSRSTETAEMVNGGKSLGSVTFETNVQYNMDDVHDCPDTEGELCVSIHVDVECKSAAGLPDLDQYSMGTSDPYCKVRVKKDDNTFSTKDATRYIMDNENPEWKEQNTFSYDWEAFVLDNDDGSDEKIPWTMDQMSLFEQFLANTRFLAKHAVLDGKECSAIKSPSTVQTRMCATLVQFEEVQVDSAQVEEVKKTLSDEDGKCLSRLESKAPNSFVEVSNEAGALLEARSHLERVKRVRTGAGCMACMSRRRSGGGGGGSSRRRAGDGGGGGGGWVGVVLLVLLIIICL